MKRERFLARLSRSGFYRDYQRAFTSATGLAMKLRHAEAGRTNGHPASLFLAVSSIYDHLRARRAKAASCFGRVTEASVPVHHGRRLLGFLQTNEFVLGPLGPQPASRAAGNPSTKDFTLDPPGPEKPAVPMRILSVAEYDVVLGLLSTFAGQLGVCMHQLDSRAQKAQS
jgi:hypothetical protein